MQCPKLGRCSVTLTLTSRGKAVFYDLHTSTFPECITFTFALSICVLCSHCDPLQPQDPFLKFAIGLDICFPYVCSWLHSPKNNTLHSFLLNFILLFSSCLVKFWGQFEFCGLLMPPSSMSPENWMGIFFRKLEKTLTKNKESSLVNYTCFCVRWKSLIIISWLVKPLQPFCIHTMSVIYRIIA